MLINACLHLHPVPHFFLLRVVRTKKRPAFSDVLWKCSSIDPENAVTFSHWFSPVDRNASVLWFLYFLIHNPCQYLCKTTESRFLLWVCVPLKGVFWSQVAHWAQVSVQPLSDCTSTVINSRKLFILKHDVTETSELFYIILLCLINIIIVSVGSGKQTGLLTVGSSVTGFSSMNM